MEKKPYQVKTGNGRMTVSARVEGKARSVNVPYPLVLIIDKKPVKLNRKATIDYCLDRLVGNI